MEIWEIIVIHYQKLDGLNHITYGLACLTGGKGWMIDMLIDLLR